MLLSPMPVIKAMGNIDKGNMYAKGNIDKCTIQCVSH